MLYNSVIILYFVVGELIKQGEHVQFDVQIDLDVSDGSTVMEKSDSEGVHIFVYANCKL